MNERIRELWQQSNVLVLLQEDASIDANLQLFAELILRDAAQYIENPIAVSKLMSKYGVRN